MSAGQVSSGNRSGAPAPASTRLAALRLPPATRSFLRFLVAVVYFFVARSMAERGARGLVSEDWAPLVEQAMLVFLLLFGYAGFGFVMDGELSPIGKQGLPSRKGLFSEWSLGFAFGWGITVACLIPVFVFGAIALHLSFSLLSLGWLVVETAYFALATLAIEIAFRGYGFQSATRVFGETPSALIFAVLFAILNARLPNAGHAHVAVSIALSLLLTLAYLRTRALWLPWGLHFGWLATRALLFGLPVRGVGSHSPVIQAEAIGSPGLTGGNFGFDGSWLAFALLVIAMPLVYRATRDLSFLYNAPVLKPGGLPVDLDAAARLQHEAATRESTPEAKPLVQILPATSFPSQTGEPSLRESTESNPIPDPPAESSPIPTPDR